MSLKSSYKSLRSGLRPYMQRWRVPEYHACGIMYPLGCYRSSGQWFKGIVLTKIKNTYFPPYLQCSLSRFVLTTGQDVNNNSILSGRTVISQQKIILWKCHTRDMKKSVFFWFFSPSLSFSKKSGWGSLCFQVTILSYFLPIFLKAQ